MTGLFAAALAGWLCLFLLVLAAAAARRRAPWAALPPRPGAEPPAVIGLLARGPAMRLYQATLLDLSARGWFRLRPPGPAAAWAEGGPGPAMCELAAEQPRDALTPYERRALAHVAFRAGVHDEVPAPALSDGFREGEDTFLAGFRREVVTDARARGLSQPRLRAGTRALLCAAALIPAVAAVAATAPHHRTASVWGTLLAFCAVCAVVISLGACEVPSRTGRAALAWHRPGRKARGEHAGEPDRAAAYATALGRSATATVSFSPPGRDEMWSSFGGRWRKVSIGSPLEIPLLGMAVAIYCFFMFPVLSVSAILGFGGVVHGAAGVGLRACALAAVTGGVLLVSRGIARWVRLPSFAEFDGQVIRQWIIEGDDESPSSNCVAIDAGTSTRAWAFSVSAAQYRMLTPGTFVHVRANPRRNRPLSIQPTEPPPVTSRLAAVLADRQQAGENGLSDPAVLVTEQEAAGVFGCPVRGTRLDLLGRLVIWRPAAASRPSMQVMVQGGALGARIARHAARHGTPLPGADGWLLSSRSAVLHAGTLTVRVTLTDLAPAAAEAALALLVPRVAQRLRAAAGPVEPPRPAAGFPTGA